MVEGVRFLRVSLVSLGLGVRRPVRLVRPRRPLEASMYVCSSSEGLACVEGCPKSGWEHDATRQQSATERKRVLAGCRGGSEVAVAGMSIQVNSIDPHSQTATAPKCPCLCWVPVRKLYFSPRMRWQRQWPAEPILERRVLTLSNTSNT